MNFLNQKTISKETYLFVTLFPSSGKLKANLIARLRMTVAASVSEGVAKRFFAREFRFFYLARERERKCDVRRMRNEIWQANSINYKEPHREIIGNSWQ